MAAVIGALGERVPTNIYLRSSSGCSVLNAACMRSEAHALPRVLTAHSIPLFLPFEIARTYKKISWSKSPSAPL